MNRNWRGWFLGAVTVVGIAAVFWFPPIPQDPVYHKFADSRTLFEIHNFWNVFTNFPFLIVGAFGLSKLAYLQSSLSRTAYIVFCIGVIFVGFGSAYYHYSPSTATLVWDRLPMTIVFMALFSMVLSDRVSKRLGSILLSPLILIGMASVLYWYWSELQGSGDLRAYGLIQFLPMLLMPLMLIIYNGEGLRSQWLWGTLGTYSLAKLAEYFDKAIYDTTGIVSGHSIKHVLASLAVLWVIFAAIKFRRKEEAR